MTRHKTNRITQKQGVLLVGVAAAACAALFAAGLPTARVAHATLPDYPVVAGDQATNQLIAYDPAVTDWTSPSAVEWAWHPTSAEGFTSAEISAFGGVSGFKLRNYASAQRVVVTSGNGLAAIISAPPAPGGVKIWSIILPAADNLHSAELLPNGNLAVTATGNDNSTNHGYVRVYAASQGVGNTTYAQYTLYDSHGAVWDPTTDRLWVIGREGPIVNGQPTGDRVLLALAVTGSAAQPRLTLDAGRRYVLPDIGSHDLQPDPNDPNMLLLSTASYTWEFEKTTGTFTQLSNLVFVKSISRQPSGQLVQTQADEHESPPPANGCTANDWCTNTVDFYNPDTIRGPVPGAQYYRALVWNPFYNAVGDTVHGPVTDHSNAGGTWQSTQIDANSAITTIAAAALPDGTMHVETLVPGSGIWDRTRSASGTWSSATHVDSNAAITAISIAAMPNGTLHLQTVVPGSGVWDRMWTASGGWGSSSQIDNNGSITAVTAAAVPTTSILHVETLVPGSGVWDRTWSASAGWAASATQIANGCAGTGANDPCISAVSSAGLSDGTLHVQTLTPGSGVADVVRSAAGSWAAPVSIDSNDSITQISATTLTVGSAQTLHVQTIVPDYGLYDRTWSSTGGWSSATKIDSNGAIFDVYGAGTSDGVLHLGSAAYAS